MVELFTAVAFFDGPRTSQSGFVCHQTKAPHVGQVARSAYTDLSPLGWDLAVDNCLTHFDRWRPHSEN